MGVAPAAVHPLRLQVVVGPLADSIADEIRLAMPSSNHVPVAGAAMPTPAASAATVATAQAQQWLDALGGQDNVVQLDCIAMTRIRLQLADEKGLSQAQLNSLGCQGVSRLEDGVWHLLVGDQAQGLSDALKALAQRNPVRAGA